MSSGASQVGEVGPTSPRRTMRIGTWNVEYAAGKEKNERRLRRLRDMDGDIWVLTETHDDLSLAPEYTAVSTTPRATARKGARWTTIWSRFPVTKTVAVEDPNRTVAAVIDSPIGDLIVYGTVLPWGTDRGPHGHGRGWSEHHRVIPIQGGEWARLRSDNPRAALCVAGDLNMNLGGKHYYGTVRGRELLRTGLKDASLTCVTETERVSSWSLGHGPIDHICLSEPLASQAMVVGAWEGRDSDNVKLSDHSGLVVTVGGAG